MVLTACSGDEEEADTSTELPTLGEIIEMEREVWEFAEAYTVDCMDDMGLSYQERDFPDEELFVPLGQPADLSGVPFEISFPPEEAQEKGFGVYDRLVREIEREGGVFFDPNEEVVEEMSDEEAAEWTMALHGNPESGIIGCRSTAEEEAYAAQGSNMLEIQETFQFMQQAIASDPRIESVWGEWSTCVGEADYEAESIEALVGQFDQEAERLFDEAEAEGEEVSQEDLETFRNSELDAALVSAECFQEVEDTYSDIVADAKNAATSHADPNQPGLEDFLNE
ncbi:hypothetical protein [Natronoglycomyces albus]|uniref:Uncharacterized protein n=1 Tax=Natronoglycomyces albus TaxID=2811108 RepID=A0A895XS64_9ACTN|nr:hypothetical protein [Natronoglycomyces albus]QSB06169.1 hypothetical protein JQS30_04445 [Natronoglycomyces albus]